MNTRLLRFPSAEAEVCPNCDEATAIKEICKQEFEYGAGADSVVLSVQVPVWICSKCSYSFTDEDAETLRHEAICRHLNVMAPSEIVEIREKLKMTQKDLAELTKLGEASIKRWESGGVIQNASANMLLRLCENPMSRSVMREILAENELNAEPRFRTPITDYQKQCASLFKLRRMG